MGFISIFTYDCEEENTLTLWYATMYVKKAKIKGFKELYLKSELTNYYEKFGA